MRLTKIKLIAILTIVILSLFLGFQNIEAVPVYFLFFSGTIPMVSLVFLSVLLGMILGLLIGLKTSR